ncbi:MAG: hypothetical protein LBU61_03975 [Coriobacteriales bacterium]|jgi:hypothetical protein|nr:hypothetical protein [Coriobacteriales bacterium]
MSKKMSKSLLVITNSILVLTLLLGSLTACGDSQNSANDPVNDRLTKLRESVTSRIDALRSLKDDIHTNTPVTPDPNITKPDSSTPNTDSVELEIIASDIPNAEIIGGLVRDEIIQNYSQFSVGRVVSVQVAITSKGSDTWAIAYAITDNIPGQKLLYVYDVDSTFESPILTQVNWAYPPLSPGVSIDFYAENGKFVVYGGVSDYHWSQIENRRYDLSERSYMIIEGENDSVNLPIKSAESLSCYICILDSKPIEVTIFDGSDKVLLRLSERQNEVMITEH